MEVCWFGQFTIIKWPFWNFFTSINLFFNSENHNTSLYTADYNKWAILEFFHLYFRIFSTSKTFRKGVISSESLLQSYNFFTSACIYLVMSSDISYFFSRTEVNSLYEDSVSQITVHMCTIYMHAEYLTSQSACSVVYIYT